MQMCPVTITKKQEMTLVQIPKQDRIQINEERQWF